VLSNPAEFFVLTASLFLTGRVARLPYTRAALRAAQPAYYEFLSRTFGVEPG